MYKVGIKKHGRWIYRTYDTEEEVLDDVADAILWAEKVTIKPLEGKCR